MSDEAPEGGRHPEGGADDRSPGSQFRLIAGIAVLALPVVYVLALGPLMRWAFLHGWLGGTAMHVVSFVYYPIELLCRHSQLASDLFESYVLWWIPELNA